MVEGKHERGITSGFEKLDAITDGWKEGQLIILGARSSMGKTGFCLNLACNAAQSGVPVLIFSMEMRALANFQRLAYNLGGVGRDELLGDFLKHHARDKAFAGVDKLEALPIRVDDRPGQRMAGIEARAKQFRGQHPNGPCLIIVDYLQLVVANKYSGSRREDVASISRGLKRLATELRVPVLALSQLNRDAAKSSRPDNEHFSESDTLFHDSDISLLLYAPEGDHLNEELENNNVRFNVNDTYRVCRVSKNREGATGNVLLKYDLPTQKFIDPFAVPEAPVREVRHPYAEDDAPFDEFVEDGYEEEDDPLG